MKARKPTRREKQLISKYRLNSTNWLVSKSSKDMLVLIHRHTAAQRVIPEGVKYSGKTIRFRNSNSYHN